MGRFFLVEVPGIAPGSEDVAAKGSTCLFRVLYFIHLISRGQDFK